MFIDSHCHLEMLKDISFVIERARKNKVGIIVYNSINFETMKYALDLSEKYSEVKVALGIYPIDALKLNETELKEQINFIRKNKKKIIAIGEIGIDLKESSDFEAQKDIFVKFIRLAQELNLPMFIHSRGAEERVIQILEEEKATKVVMHCFCGNFKLVDRIVKNGWMLTIPTNVTFSEHFQKVVERIPLDNILCETDSPFLHPIKGKRDNEPGNIIESYKMIAKIKKFPDENFSLLKSYGTNEKNDFKIKKLSLKEVEKKIEYNFKKLFKI